VCCSVLQCNVFMCIAVCYSDPSPKHHLRTHGGVAEVHFVIMYVRCVCSVTQCTVLQCVAPKHHLRMRDMTHLCV